MISRRGDRGEPFDQASPADDGFVDRLLLSLPIDVYSPVDVTMMMVAAVNNLERPMTPKAKTVNRKRPRKRHRVPPTRRRAARARGARGSAKKQRPGGLTGPAFTPELSALKTYFTFAIAVSIGL
jgi:hypothetical protein